MVARLAKLEVFKEASEHLRNKPVSTEYLEKEKTELRLKRRQRRKEISTIAMDSKKFHKAFSL